MELKTDVVGPVIGRELVRNAVIAIAVSAAGILLTSPGGLNTVLLQQLCFV